MSTGPTRKPAPDIYTVLLVVSLLAIIVATVFLYLEANSTEYGSPPYEGALSRPTPAEFRLAAVEGQTPLGCREHVVFT